MCLYSLSKQFANWRDIRPFFATKNDFLTPADGSDYIGRRWFKRTQQEMRHQDYPNPSYKALTCPPLGNHRRKCISFSRCDLCMVQLRKARQCPPICPACDFDKNIVCHSSRASFQSFSLSLHLKCAIYNRHFLLCFTIKHSIDHQLREREKEITERLKNVV